MSKNLDFRVINDADYINKVLDEVQELLNLRGINRGLGFNVFLNISQTCEEKGMISAGIASIADIDVMAVGMEASFSNEHTELMNKIAKIGIAKLLSDEVPKITRIVSRNE